MCVRHVLAHLQPHHAAELALPHALFDGLQQVFRLQFLDGDFGVARDVEGVRLHDLHARETARPGWPRSPLRARRTTPCARGRAALPGRLHGRVSGTSAGSESGTLTRAKCSSPLASRMSTARFRLRLEMCGKGRPGSNASGVSTGKTISEKYRLHAASCFSVNSVVVSRYATPSCASAGMSSFSRHFAPRPSAASLRAGWPPVARVGLMRSGPELRRCRRPPARQTGHADHEELVQVGADDGEKPTRSSSGLPGSRASSSTRHWKSSRPSSRLTYIGGVVELAGECVLRALALSQPFSIA